MAAIDRERTQRLYASKAPNYRLLHHLATLWCDTRWRRTAAEAVPRHAERVLDLCTGTGLTARAILGRPGKRSVVAIDMTAPMIRKGRGTAEASRGLDFVLGDAQTLPFPNRTFDAVVSVCGLGGVENPGKAVREAARVLRPGGVFFSIEMSTPRTMLSLLWHKGVVAPLVQRFWAFRDIPLEKLVTEAGMKVGNCAYRMERGVGSICEVSAEAS